MKQSRIWITWEQQRRNIGLSNKVNAKLYVLVSNKSRVARYLLLSIRTLGIIVRDKPQVVFAQNPSIVLSSLVLLLRPFFRYRLVIDEHNSGLFPLEGASRVLNFIAGQIIKRADLLIVTNDKLREHVTTRGGETVVVPDPLPELAVVEPRQNKAPTVPIQILFICTWSADEPYQNLIQAGGELDPAAFRIIISGKYEGKIDPQVIPESVRLTGFLDDAEYVQTLADADAVVVLTTRENCLNCGAYEAVALEKPGILSDTAALRSHFKMGFIYTNSDPESIHHALRELSEHFDVLKKQSRELRGILEQGHQRYLVELEAELSRISG